MLLQCAVVDQVAKIHKDNQDIALSNQVKLNGIKSAISSGEELLKVWFLLSNYGHAQWTYGVERTLLQIAQKDDSLRKWLTRGLGLKDISDWSEQVITSYEDEKMHYVLSLLRITYFPARDRRKKIFTNYLRNLLLPIDQLFLQDTPSKHKMIRLRTLFKRIRLLCLVTLDSYYSHHPIKIEIQSALNNIANFSTSLENQRDFANTLNRIAGWLADELYLHPSSLAVQREYEVRRQESILRRFNKFKRSKETLFQFLNDFLNQGFGNPKLGNLVPLVRLSFPRPRQSLLGSQNNFQLLNQLSKELVKPPATQISVDRNPFTGDLHIDFFFSPNNAAIYHIASVFVRIHMWLVRTVEADQLRGYREMFPQASRSLIERQSDFKRRIFERILNAEGARMRNVFQSIFYGLIRYILPNGWNAVVSEYLPSPDGPSPILALIRYKEGIYDQVRPELDKHLSNNPRNLSINKLHELKTIKRVLGNCKAPFVLVCAEKYVISDQIGKTRDEWDGVILEIDCNGVYLTVIEAKNTRASGNRANIAFKQLDQTRKFCCTKNMLSYRRQRLPRLGAKIKFFLTVK